MLKKIERLLSKTGTTRKAEASKLELVGSGAWRRLCCRYSCSGRQQNENIRLCRAVACGESSCSNCTLNSDLNIIEEFLLAEQIIAKNHKLTHRRQKTKECKQVEKSHVRPT